MAIVNSIKALFPGFGAPTEYVSLLTEALTRNATSTHALTGFRNPIRSGRLRMKTISPPVAATQVTAIKIVGDDGVTSVTLYQDTQTRTAAENIDLFFDFLSDLNLTTLTVSVTAANAGAADQTCDFEVGANP
jgi:alpha-D-ribose 1-methylphosphonate 5-phosphate C-P lyase